MPDPAPPTTLPVRRTWLLLISLPILGLAWILGSGHGLLGLADHVGYAICHQITVRSYAFGDQVLPLCARCTGQYLGLPIVLVLAWRWGRLRASALPPRPLLALLLGFLIVWAFDGFNSYITLILGRPFLYPPHNLLRLSTGMLQGLAVGFIVVPLFNQIVWAQPGPQPSLAGWRELATALGLGALLVLAVHSRWLPLFYPLAVLSTLSAFLMLSLVGMLFTLLVLRQEQSNRNPADLWTLLPPGMAFASLLLIAVHVARAFAENTLGLRLPPG